MYNIYIYIYISIYNYIIYSINGKNSNVNKIK